MDIHSITLFCKKDEIPTFKVSIGTDKTYPVGIRIDAIDIYLTSESDLIKFRNSIILAKKGDQKTTESRNKAKIPTVDRHYESLSI